MHQKCSMGATLHTCARKKKKCFMLTTNEFMGQLFVNFFFFSIVKEERLIKNVWMNNWLLNWYKQGKCVFRKYAFHPDTDHDIRYDLL